MGRRVTVAILALGLGFGLTACSSSYTQVYGKVIDREEGSTTSLIPVGKVFVSQTTPYYYLSVDYSSPDEEGVTQDQWSVTGEVYDSCQEGDFIFREESGAVSCSPESFR